jgi:hypothetical protein
MVTYSEHLLPPNSFGCFACAAPTSQLYASSTVIQLTTEINKLWRYAALPWHNNPTKNSGYQRSSSRLGVDGYTTNSVNTWNSCCQNLLSKVENGILYTTII